MTGSDPAATHDDPLLTHIRDSPAPQAPGENKTSRTLIAYAREFTRPRPYRLTDLAEAAGMSVLAECGSAYDHAMSTAQPRCCSYAAARTAPDA